ncbi:MAG: ATP-binding protein [Treponema sp.]|jgi:DNA replication protein DnaC|nr:ATP-binding protein [Treponema sp.]
MVEAKKIGDIAGYEELPEQEYTCKKHGKYIGKPFKFGFINSVIGCPCPKCLEEDEARRLAEERKRTEEENEKRRTHWLTDLNIGRRFWNESFETFNAYTPELQHHLSVCMEFAKDPQGRKLVMLGNSGTGKNHMAASILKMTGGVIHKIMEIELLFDRTFSGEIHKWEIIKNLCETDMLVIDEIGRTKPTDFELNWLSYVIDKRHENYKPLVLISNKHLEEDCPRGESGCPDCIQKFMGKDTFSRITEDGLIMEFTGEDYRYKIREGKNV